MRIFTRLFLTLLYTFSVNHAFAAKYYYQNTPDGINGNLILGDSSFSYSLTKHQDSSEEYFEKGLTRVTVVRNNVNATMWIEQKTKTGFLTFKYIATGKRWDNTGITFRRYSSFYKGAMKDECAPVPSTKNLEDIAAVGKSSELQNFANLMFEKSCQEKLTPQEFNNLVNNTYALLVGDLGLLKEPRIISCIKGQGEESKIRAPFNRLREKVNHLVAQSNSIEDIKKDPSAPFPIACDFDGKEKKLCGVASEGLKTKINFDASCLKGQGANKEQAISLFMHEFTHTLRFPKSENSKQLLPLSEKQVQQIEAGNCNPKDILFANVGETDLGKNTTIAKENAKSTGAKTLAGDVANPYSSFAERATTPAATQTTNIAANETSSGAIETNERSGSSGAATQQRNIASTNAFNVGTNSSSSSKYSVPSIQQQAQYQNVKTYVDASIGTVARKIAPIVNYVENPAFAQTLPPTSFENSNSGDDSAATASTNGTIATAKSAAVNRAAGGTSRSGETGASTNGGSTATVSSGNTANLGNSNSSSSSRSPAAINKNANRLSGSDGNLDNAYALKVRKKLLSDSSYRTELRNKGVQIEFADGYKFETPSSTVLYTEKNGVLVRGK